MENKNEKVISVLTELAEFVKDGKLGYKKAAEETKDATLKQFCNEHSQQRAEFLTELNGILTRLGGSPETSGTVKGSIYRQWMDVKATLTGNDEGAIINSCLYGEEWAQKAYHDALEHSELPTDVRQMVEKQHQASHTAYSQLEGMKKQKQM
jgi:uncharacterized protein (TIGR02284 family)